MLQVQEYLRQHHSLDTLESQLGIKSNFHDDGRVILNYDQIESPKTHPIVKECRGLVLDSYDWALVARSFPRFFNAGECPSLQSRFNWDQCLATDKEDGSLILIYYWDDEWHINTRNSFGSGYIDGGDITWRELVLKAMNVELDNLDPAFTYVCEVCSSYNRVVRQYDTPKIFLLSTFDKEVELTHDATDSIGREFGFCMPNVYKFDSVMDARSYITEVAKNDPTYEGIVLRDVHNNRIKVKSQKYVELHRLYSNGNIFRLDRLAQVVLDGEEDEVLIYFPELTDRINQVKNTLQTAWNEIEAIWFCHHDQRSRKKYAKAVKNHRLCPILFRARDCGSLSRAWDEMDDLLIKTLFRK